MASVKASARAEAEFGAAMQSLSILRVIEYYMSLANLLKGSLLELYSVYDKAMRHAHAIPAGPVTGEN